MFKEDAETMFILLKINQKIIDSSKLDNFICYFI